MKTKLFILLLFSMTIVPIAFGQLSEAPAGYQSPYFDRKDYIAAEGDTTLYLYEKGNRFEPERIHPGQFVPGFRKMSKDILPLFKGEFPNLTYPDDLSKFGGIMLRMYIDHEGNIISYYYQFKSDDLYLYPDMEKHLYNFAISIKNEGLKKYDIYAIFPDTYCQLNYLFFYMYRALVFPEKK